MYLNKCIKCGAEFETKNPKRVICPNCLYAEKKTEGNSDNGSEQTSMASYSSENYQQQRQTSFGGGYEDRPRNNYQQREGGYSQGGYSAGGYSSGGYQRREGGYSQGGYSSGGYQRRDNNRDGGSYGGGYQRRDNNGYQRQGGYQRRDNNGYQRPQGGGYQRRDNNGYQRSQQGGYNRDNNRGGFQQRRPQAGGNRFGGGRKPQRPQKPAKPLLVTKEQLETIEALYKTMLPLPNPDAHEVIGAKMELEPRKVFFGINLVRQKLMLPKLPYPKRKLAISEDQMLAIKSLYEPLLPLPPIGCHKIIATQLRMDEWRVHVGIGLIRAQMGLERWNQDRPDAPEEYKKQKAEETVVEEKPKTKRTSKKKAEAESEDSAVTVTEVTEEKPKKTRTTRKKAEVTEEAESSETEGKAPKKRATRKTKKDEE